MRYSFISDPLSRFLSGKEVVREVKSSSRLISFAAETDFPFISDIDSLRKNHKNLFYFNRPSEGFFFITAGELSSISDGGIGRFSAIDKKVKQIQDKLLTNWSNSDIRVPLFNGGMKFTIEHNDADWKDFKDSNWIIPQFIFLSDKGKNYIIYNFFYTRTQNADSVVHELEEALDKFILTDNQPEKPPRIISIHGNTPKDRKKWKNMVQRALEQIYESNVKKIVLSRKLELLLGQDASFNYIIKNLEEKFPECAVFLFKSGSSLFFGASPEKLFRLNRNNLVIDALAGSADLHSKTLFSDKNIKEHDFVLDHIKEVISPFANNVEVPRLHDTKKLNNISHIWSEISADLKDGNPIFIIIKELFPTPAVCGIPKEAAMNLIKKLEEHRRGLYSGIIGWFNFTEAEFYVSIRSALCSGNKVLAYAGCGIVEGSDPEEEFDETELKLIPILSLFKNENKSQPQYTLD